MAKQKYRTSWFCNECGAESPKWSGRCPSCGAWNTMVEEKVVETKGSSSIAFGGGKAERLTAPEKVSEIAVRPEARIKMPSGELNRVLGGGLVEGSIVLIGGEPGIGKSDRKSVV